MATVDSSLAAKCMDFCHALTSQNKFFTFLLIIGKANLAPPTTLSASGIPVYQYSGMPVIRSWMPALFSKYARFEVRLLPQAQWNKTWWRRIVYFDIKTWYFDISFWWRPLICIIASGPNLLWCSLVYTAIKYSKLENIPHNFLLCWRPQIS